MRSNVVELRSIGWDRPDLSLLNNGTVQPPRFPRELLGQFWSDWCEAVSASANAPFDYAGASLLALAGSMIGNTRTVNVGSWSEPPILWVANIGNPSSGKSPAMDPFMDLISVFEAQFAKTTQRKIHIDDASAQATAVVAAQNPTGVLLFRDELSAWWQGFGQLGGEQFWLKGFGARPHTVHRKKEEPIHVPRLSVSVLGGAQPDTLRAFVETKNNKGLAARLCYIFPNPATGFRLSGELDLASAVSALQKLVDLPLGSRPVPCPVAPSVLPILEEWVTRKRAEAADADGVWAEWLGKQGGVALRISLILEYLWWAAKGGKAKAPKEVSEKAYRAAIQFIDEYAAPMAARTLDMAARPVGDKAAAKLARLLKKTGTKEFNARDVRRNSLGPVGELANGPVMAAACEVLEAAHLIRHVGQRAGDTTGRRPSTYEVNEVLLTLR